MKVILFGATGMVGQGALLECLRDPDVEAVLCVGRRRTGRQHERLREVVLEDVSNPSAIGDDLAGHDACLFCLGVSSAGMSEADYRRITYDTTMAVAEALLARNPALTFAYVSGAGTDSSEHGRVMWARVKGQTENALLRMPFKAAYMFRPGYIQPLDGIRASTRGIRVLYAVFGPLYPIWKRLFPRHVTTTRRLGRAMIRAAREGAPKRILEVADINDLAHAGCRERAAGSDFPLRAPTGGARPGERSWPMKYMLMMHAPKGTGDWAVSDWTPEALKAHMDFMMRLNKDLSEAGELVGAEGLAGPGEARVVRATKGGGAPAVTDGPFPEAKEFLAGFWIVDCESPKRAYEIAGRASSAPGPDGAPLNMPIEVRQVMSLPGDESIAKG